MGPAIIPLERIDVDKYTREVERKVKRSKSLDMKLRWLRYHIEDLSKVLDTSRSLAQKLEDEGKVDTPDSTGIITKSWLNALRDLKLNEEQLLIESVITDQQAAEVKQIRYPRPNQPFNLSLRLLWRIHAHRGGRCLLENQSINVSANMCERRNPMFESWQAT